MKKLLVILLLFSALFALEKKGITGFGYGYIEKFYDADAKCYVYVVKDATHKPVGITTVKVN